jgi:hypothetical protein
LFSNQKNKQTIWIHFGGPWNGKRFYIWYIFDHLEYFMAIWYNLRQLCSYSLWWFGIFFTFWYVWTKKNLATLYCTIYVVVIFEMKKAA